MSDDLMKKYRNLLRSDFLTFTNRAFLELNPGSDFALNWHLDVLADKLQAVMDGRIKRLVINLPPRHLKSIFSSVALPAFWLGHDPSAQIICVSYAQDLADKMARDCRTVMSSLWYQATFGVRLGSKTQLHDLTTLQNGCRYATSVGGALTGRGADVLIIDDPMKPIDAASEAGRQTGIDWYQNTLLSRLNSKEDGRIILVMQRLHEDDLTGHVLEQEGWTVVSFPAIATEDQTYAYNTVFGPQTYFRAVGEVLHPVRESLATLTTLRASMKEENFSAQYQQQPLPPGGAMIKSSWIQYYEPDQLPPFARIVQSWDTATKAHDRADYSVCTTWGMTNDRKVYLLDVYRARLEYPELKVAVRRCASEFQPRDILIEDKSSGSSLVQELKREGLSRIVPYAVPGFEKEMRVYAQTERFAAGSVFMPTEAPWLAAYLAELTGFPGTKHDDQVDSTVNFLQWIWDIWRPSIYDLVR